MKVLLINPPLDNLLSAGIPSLVGKRGFFPAMGILYIASYCSDNSDHQIEVIDASLEGLTYRQLAERVRGAQPDLVGITCLTFTLIDSLKTAEMVKSISPEILVVLGGIHVTLFPEESIQPDCVDFAIKGEGEITFTRLLDKLENRKSLREIPGIIFKDGNKIIDTGIPSPIEDLNDLPFPKRNLTPYHKFKSYENDTAATTMISSRGCPFNCLFCFRPYYDKKLRFRSAENIISEIEKCLELGIGEIHFYDDTFTIDRDRVLELCEMIKVKNLNFRWSVMTKVDLVDPKLLMTMKESGCYRIRYGVESGSNEILKILRKGITVNQAQEAFRISREAGISTVAYFVLGSPTETEDQIKSTLKLAKDLKADFTNFSIITMYPGTDLYRLAFEKKILTRDVWREFSSNPVQDFIPPFWEEYFSREQLIKFQSKAYKTVYLNSVFIKKKLKRFKNFRSFVEMFHLGAKMVKYWLKAG